RKTLTPRTPYGMTFRSSEYYEGQNGSLGFHWLVIVPLGLLGFAIARRRPAVSSAFVAFGAGAIILNTEPNARYLYAAMPLALIPHEGANAGTDGDIYENHWHQVTTLLKISEAPDVPAMLKLMQGWNLRYFIGHKPAPGELASPPMLAEFLAACTLPEFEIGD